jgi:hypothetical protein
VREVIFFVHPVMEKGDELVLLLGDSVDRSNVEFFCEFANSVFRVATMRDLNEDFPGQRNGSHQWTTSPCICRVEDYDFDGFAMQPWQRLAFYDALE